MEDDQSIANLMSMIARHYQTQITDPGIPKNKTRLEILRKLELISQSIKGLMKHQQDSL
jgi:hypothetical protein